MAATQLTHRQSDKCDVDEPEIVEPNGCKVVELTTLESVECGAAVAVKQRYVDEAGKDKRSLERRFTQIVEALNVLWSHFADIDVKLEYAGGAASLQT